MLTPLPETRTGRSILICALGLLPAIVLGGQISYLETAQLVTGQTEPAGDRQDLPAARPGPDEVMVGPSPLPEKPGPDERSEPKIHHELSAFEKSQLAPLPARSLWERLLDCQDGAPARKGWLRNLAKTDANAPIFSQTCGVDWHKSIFLLPYTYSRDYESDQTEVLFGISAKLRPLSLPLYFAYTQRSFWSLYDDSNSRPFRETVYNPEIFYRWIPETRPSRDWSWGLDGGYEHESNGRDLPASRSWDRLFVAPFFERGGTAAQLKIWYRIPEDARTDANDPSGDDNPDIEQFYGYTELHLYRRFDRDRPFHIMIRGNPSTGRGAFQVDHAWRIGKGNLFWHAYLWHGYGESLTDYNNSITRIGVGFSMNR